MLRSNIGIALGQRRSALGRREYFELVGRGRGYPCGRIPDQYPRPLCQVIKVRLIALTPRRDLVHQKFTFGTLIEKRAHSRVLVVRDGELWGRSAPVLHYLCQVLQGKPGKPPARGTDDSFGLVRVGPWRAPLAPRFLCVYRRRRPGFAGTPLLFAQAPAVSADTQEPSAWPSARLPSIDA